MGLPFTKNLVYLVKNPETSFVYLYVLKTTSGSHDTSLSFQTVYIVTGQASEQLKKFIRK